MVKCRHEPQMPLRYDLVCRFCFVCCSCFVYLAIEFRMAAFIPCIVFPKSFPPILLQMPGAGGGRGMRKDRLETRDADTSLDVCLDLCLFLLPFNSHPPLHVISTLLSAVRVTFHKRWFSCFRARVILKGAYFFYCSLLCSAMRGLDFVG